MLKKISVISALLFCFTLGTAQAEIMTYTFGGVLNELFIINTDAEDWLPPGEPFTGSFTYSATETTLSLGIADQGQDFPLEAAYQIINNDTSGADADTLILRGYQSLDFLDPEIFAMLEGWGISEMYYIITLTDSSGMIFDATTLSATYSNPMDIAVGLNLTAVPGTPFEIAVYSDANVDFLLGSGSGYLNHISPANSAPTPEPASALLTGLGLAGLIALGRRRKALA